MNLVRGIKGGRPFSIKHSKVLPLEIYRFFLVINNKKGKNILRLKLHDVPNSLSKISKFSTNVDILYK